MVRPDKVATAFPLAPEEAPAASLVCIGFKDGAEVPGCNLMCVDKPFEIAPDVTAKAPSGSLVCIGLDGAEVIAKLQLQCSCCINRPASFLDAPKNMLTVSLVSKNVARRTTLQAGMQPRSGFLIYATECPRRQPGVCVGSIEGAEVSCAFSDAASSKPPTRGWFDGLQKAPAGCESVSGGGAGAASRKPAALLHRSALKWC